MRISAGDFSCVDGGLCSPWLGACRGCPRGLPVALKILPDALQGGLIHRVRGTGCARRRMNVMSLTSRVVWILLCSLVWSAACANEMPESKDDGKGAAGAPSSPLVGATAGSSSAPSTAPKPNAAPASTPASSGSTSQPSQSTTPPAAVSGSTAGSASPAKPAATSGSAGSGGSAAPATSAAGSAAPPAASGGTAGAAAPLPDLDDILPPLSTPETRIPSPSNPAECPATAPEDPVGDCLGLPIYLECNYGTYFCVCDWYHWLCAG